MATVAVRRSFVDTSSFVFLVFLGLAGYGLFLILPIVLERMAAHPGPGLFAALVWALYGGILLVILYRMELFERRSTVTIAGAFVWGAVVVTGIGTKATPAMAGIASSWLGPEQADWVPAIAAPLVEEPLKLLGVLALAMIPGARINSALDGLFFGMIVGLGFEVVESYLYTVDAVAAQGGGYAAVFSMLLLRGVISGLWTHPTFSGISGAGVGYYFGSPRPRLRRLVVASGCLLLAIVLHGLFNSPLLAASPVIGAIVKGLPTLVVLLVILRMARNDERSRFDHAAVLAIDRALLGDGERQTLLHRSTRRRAVEEMRASSGDAAALALKELQDAQIEMVEEAIYDGVGSAGFQSASNRVRMAKASLSDLT
ncbi:MAG TPA: PrsW family intramembrane metalloprotease [Acidimicrobiia bacterium]|nr:PrsW family intramembrane metalloprotease [Acidimicrobiia bacterium]